MMGDVPVCRRRNGFARRCEKQDGDTSMKIKSHWLLFLVWARVVIPLGSGLPLSAAPQSVEQPSANQKTVPLPYRGNDLRGMCERFGRVVPPDGRSRESGR